MKAEKLNRNSTGVLVVDIQDKLFPYIENSCHLIQSLQLAVRGLQILGLPIVATEQYPKGLGHTIPQVKGVLGEKQQYFVKTAFSCLDDPTTKEFILSLPIKDWVLVGIEAHVCILQTAKDLILNKKGVVVLNDAIGSRSVYDYSTAIAEMRDFGARITSTETILFELLRDSKASEFKQISELIK